MKRLTLLLLCLVPILPAQDALKYREYLDAAARVDHFSGTVLVASKGQIEFQQAYGLADRAANKPNTVDTIYRIGSMSKPITATAVMALRDGGKLKLDDSICV
jgi:CubicO group peptidase (beta-lactamase class C family)